MYWFCWDGAHFLHSTHTVVHFGFVIKTVLVMQKYFGYC